MKFPQFFRCRILTATDYCIQLTSCFAKAHTVTDVFDRRYDGKNSIKSAERERRTKVTAHTKVFQVIESRNIPDWKEFLSVKENKQALINFLVTSLSNSIKVTHWCSLEICITLLVHLEICKL
jgi:hypothetical protein